MREPTSGELGTIGRELEACSASVPPTYSYLIHELKYKELFVFTQHILCSKALELASLRNVYFAGVFGGAFREERFRVSLDFAEHLYNQGLWRKAVRLDVSQTQAFLYGRSIMDSSFSGLPLERTLVLSNSGDVIGLGVIERAPPRLLHLIDKGWYLRTGG